MMKQAEGIDDLDLKILRILQRDGRASYADIARQLGVPQSTVRFKVNRLISMGVIKRFAAILNPQKLGFTITLIMLLRIDTRRLMEIFRRIAEMPEAHHVLQITGKYDIAAIFHARDMDHANEIINRVKGIEGVVDAETMIATGLLEIKAELAI